MKKRKLKAKLHNKFLWLVTYSAVILFTLSMSAMDSESCVIPAVIMILSLAWLLLFSLANEERW
jgi:hypothetical protein